MICPNCGSKLPDDAVFCGECGARLDKAERQERSEALLESIDDRSGNK